MIQLIVHSTRKDTGRISLIYIIKKEEEKKKRKIGKPI